jgi:hypothetical protein
MVPERVVFRVPARQPVQPPPQIIVQRQAWRILWLIDVIGWNGRGDHLAKPPPEPLVVRRPRLRRRVEKGQDFFESGFVIDGVKHGVLLGQSNGCANAKVPALDRAARFSGSRKKVVPPR